MPFDVVMSDQQKVAIGATILDADGQPFAALPDGATLSFDSSDPAVAVVTVRPDGMNADIGSGKVGTAVVTITAGGSISGLAGDVVNVTVKNSVPGSLNLTVGAPESE